MIRKIQNDDKQEYIKLVKEFYSSKAVDHTIPDKHIFDTFSELVSSETYASCYIMEYDKKVAGYALLAKTFSQEAGGMVYWIEEIYVRPTFRNYGLGREFLSFLKTNLAINIKRIRLEVTDSNHKAISLYKRSGFSELPYSQMIIDIK